jgi:hypothetical protein
MVRAHRVMKNPIMWTPRLTSRFRKYYGTPITRSQPSMNWVSFVFSILYLFLVVSSVFFHFLVVSSVFFHFLVNFLLVCHVFDFLNCSKFLNIFGTFFVKYSFSILSTNLIWLEKDFRSSQRPLYMIYLSVG